MIRPSELELHARAQKLFEQENPGRLWRTPASLPMAPSPSEQIAGLIERQAYLARIQGRMRAEGVRTIPDEGEPS